MTNKQNGTPGETNMGSRGIGSSSRTKNWSKKMSDQEMTDRLYRIRQQNNESSATALAKMISGGKIPSAPKPVHGGNPAQVQARQQGESRSYAFDISIPRQVKGELKIVGQFGKEDLERLKKALNGQLAMIEAALED